MSFYLIRECKKVFQCFVEFELTFHRFPVTRAITKHQIICLHMMHRITYDPVSIWALWFMFADEILIRFCRGHIRRHQVTGVLVMTHEYVDSPITTLSAVVPALAPEPLGQGVD